MGLRHSNVTLITGSKAVVPWISSWYTAIWTVDWMVIAGLDGLYNSLQGYSTRATFSKFASLLVQVKINVKRELNTGQKGFGQWPVASRLLISMFRVFFVIFANYLMLCASSFALRICLRLFSTKLS